MNGKVALDKVNRQGRQERQENSPRKYASISLALLASLAVKKCDFAVCLDIGSLFLDYCTIVV